MIALIFILILFTNKIDGEIVSSGASVGVTFEGKDELHAIAESHAQELPKTRNRRMYAMCPPSFQRIGTECYLLVGQPSSWLEAHFFCKDKNAKLAEPQKYSDRKLREYLQQQDAKTAVTDAIWIGATYDHRNHLWQWSISGKNLSYDAFTQLAPNQQLANHCANYEPQLGYRWSVHKCSDKLRFMCQHKMPKVSGRNRHKVYNRWNATYPNQYANEIVLEVIDESSKVDRRFNRRVIAEGSNEIIVIPSERARMAQRRRQMALQAQAGRKHPNDINFNLGGGRGGRKRLRTTTTTRLPTTGMHMGTITDNDTRLPATERTLTQFDRKLQRLREKERRRQLRKRERQERMRQEKRERMRELRRQKQEQLRRQSAATTVKPNATTVAVVGPANFTLPLVEQLRRKHAEEAQKRAQEILAAAEAAKQKQKQDEKLEFERKQEEKKQERERQLAAQREAKRLQDEENRNRLEEQQRQQAEELRQKMDAKQKRLELERLEKAQRVEEQELARLQEENKRREERQRKLDEEIKRREMEARQIKEEEERVRKELEQEELEMRRAHDEQIEREAEELSRRQEAERRDAEERERQRQQKLAEAKEAAAARAAREMEEKRRQFAERIANLSPGQKAKFFELRKRRKQLKQEALDEQLRQQNAIATTSGVDSDGQ